MPYTYETDEFQKLLKKREMAWEQTIRGLANSIVVRQQLGPEVPEPLASLEAFDVGSLIAQADPQTQALVAMKEAPLRQMRNADELIGAARFYGIRNAERLPVEELEELVARRRETLRDYAAGQELNVGQALYNGVATAIGQALTTPGQETLRIVGNLAERIPFLGQAISRSETMREADRWFSMVQEGLTGDLPEGRRELSRGVAGAVGMFPAAYLSWQALGLTGLGARQAVVGNSITPLGRASLAWRGAVRGALTEQIIQDPTAPLSEQAINASFGALFGGAEVLGGRLGATLMGTGMGGIAGALADEGDPRTTVVSGALGGAIGFLGHGLLNKVRRSFPSAALDPEPPRLGPGDGPLDAPFGSPDGPIVEGDWVGEQLMRQPRGPGEWTPAGELPSPAAMEGTIEPWPQVGRGQPWLPEQSSLIDAEFEVMGGSVGPAPTPSLPLNRQLPPGQYEVFGVSGPTPGGSPPSPSGGPSIWMQTPPEVRQFIRRVVGERRAARRAAEVDPMTGAGNRAAWGRAAPAAEADPGMAIVALDVNNLKAANDLVGHEFGDEMILGASRAAQQAAEQLGLPNRIFRMGGDEFVAIVPQDRAQEYLGAVEAAYGQHAAQSYTVSVSGGIGQTLEEADQALRARKSGRGAAAFRQLDPQQAAAEAGQLSKQASVMESPILADVSGVPQLDDADAAWAVVESFPGQVGVVQNVGDVASTVRRILRDQMPNGVGPQDFRVVQREIRPRVRLTSSYIDSHEAQFDFIAQAPTGEEISIYTDFDPVTGYLDFTEIGRLRGGVDLDDIDHTRVPAGEGWTRAVGAEIIRQIETGGRAVEAVGGFRATGARSTGGRGGDTTVRPASGLRRPVRKQTDILVSSGRPITNKMVRDYETYGMFEGQRAKLSTGQEVVIESIGPETSFVRPRRGGPTAEVATANLLPMKSSAIVDDVPGLYESFETFAGVRLDQQAIESGLATTPSLFSDEGATQVPLLMEEFLRTMGVDPKSYYGVALRELMEQRHLENIRRLAPPEEQAFVRAVQEEAMAVVRREAKPLASVEDLALARGMDLERRPSGLDLVDDVSRGDVRVPLENDAAAREFLHGFQREAIDDTPVTPFPLEVLETPPGYSETTGAVPGVWQSADQYADALEETIESYEGLFGGGGGRIPPPPGGGPLGAGDDPLRLPPVESSLGVTHNEQWYRARRDDPRRVKRLLSWMDGIISETQTPMRNLFERMQAQARQMGVETADYYTQMRELDSAYNRVINSAHPWEERAFDILNPVRNRFWRDGTFWEVLNAPLWEQPALMKNAGFKPEERLAVEQWRDLMDEFYVREASVAHPEMGRIENYISWFRQFEEGLPGDPLRYPRIAEWGPAQTRGAGPELIEKNMGAIIPRYFRTFYKEQFMQQPYDRLRQLAVGDDVPEIVKDALRTYADNKMWGLDPAQDWMVKGTTQLLNTLGKGIGETFSKRDAQKLWNLQFNAAYRAGLGGQISPLVRDMPQGFIGAMHIGLDKALPRLKRLLRDADYRDSVRALAQDAGWIQVEGGSSIDPDIFGASSPGSGVVREAGARTVDFIQDQVLSRLSMRHGIQGTWLDWLAPYGRLGDFMRAWNAVTNYEVASEALQRYAAAQASRQSWAVPLEDLQEQLLRESRVGRYQTGIQQSFLDYVNRGDYEGAARFFGGEGAASQNIYGMAQQPRAWQSWGPVTGKKATQWLTFNNQTLVNMVHVATDKGIPWQQRAAYFGQTGALQAGMAAAQAVTGWNFMRMSLLGIGFGYAGSGIYDWINRVQRIDALFSQNDPTGRPLDPDARALMGSPGNSYGSPLDPRYSPLNPWAGGLRTVQGLSESAPWGAEGVARFLTTGERGNPQASRDRRGMTEWETMNPQMVDEILGEGRGPLREPSAPSQPGFGAMY